MGLFNKQAKSFICSTAALQQGYVLPLLLLTGSAVVLNPGREMLGKVNLWLCTNYFCPLQEILVETNDLIVSVGQSLILIYFSHLAWHCCGHWPHGRLCSLSEQVMAKTTAHSGPKL